MEQRSTWIDQNVGYSSQRKNLANDFCTMRVASTQSRAVRYFFSENVLSPYERSSVRSHRKTHHQYSKEEQPHYSTSDFIFTMAEYCDKNVNI